MLKMINTLVIQTPGIAVQNALLKTKNQCLYLQDVLQLLVQYPTSTNPNWPM